jgi:hypothetical protein
MERNRNPSREAWESPANPADVAGEDVNLLHLSHLSIYKTPIYSPIWIIELRKKLQEDKHL